MLVKIYQKNYHILDVVTRLACLLILIYFIIPFRFASHYEFIRSSEILDSFVEHVTQNISLQQIESCDYNELILSNDFYFTKEHKTKVLNVEQILPGGEFYPNECRSKFSVAIIVPYRQREEQLHAFLTYMHNYLRQQKIHYRIFLIEQNDSKPFNRAKLFNVGAVVAAQHGFPCLVLHDVDLLPLNAGQLYACSVHPRHMCSALDTFRFNLPYRGLFGGVVAIRTEQFRSINGMSNLYEGWGGEDDDFFERLQSRNYQIIRFEPAYSMYTMLRHKKQAPNEERLSLLQSSTLRFQTDGLNSLAYEEKERRVHDLFTHILVEI